MTPIADMVERMLANNDPHQAIVAAVRALECVTVVTRSVTLPSRDASRSVTQEQARVRAQNYRNRKKFQSVAKANDVAAPSVTVTPIVTRDDVTEAISDCVVLPSLLSSSTAKPLKESKREGMRARGTRLEAGAPLSDEYRALIIAEGIQDPDKFWAEFVDYWSELPGQRGVKVGWTGTLRNRCRDVISKGFNRPSQGPKNGRRTVHEANKDLGRHLAALNEPAPSLCEPEGGGPVRLLSTR